MENNHWFGHSIRPRQVGLHEEIHPKAPGDTDEGDIENALKLAKRDSAYMNLGGRKTIPDNLPEPGDDMASESELQKQKSELLAEVDQFIALINNDRGPRSDEFPLFLNIKLHWNEESIKEKLLKNLRELRLKIDPSSDQVNINQLTKLEKRLRNLKLLGIEAPETK